MKDIKKLLELLRHHFPSTRPHQSHSLTLKNDTVVLTLMLGDTYQMFNLDEADFSKTPEELVAEVKRLFKKPKQGPKGPAPASPGPAA